MTRHLPLAALAAAVCLTGATALAEIEIVDPYARAATPSAMSGAAFMAITNSGDTPDRLIAASSDISARVELHTHIMDTGGVMRMVEVEDGFEVGPGETLMLQRGGAHAMFMGLNRSLEQGDTVEVTLTFEQAGDVTLQVPVDLERMPAGHGGHSGSMGN